MVHCLFVESVSNQFVQVEKKMPTIDNVCAYLDQLAPMRLAEDWDNVGLLVGNRNDDVQRIMTCLTITPASAAEAIEQGCQLIVSHHPLPFHPLKRLTTDNTASGILWNLIRAGVAIYSPHTGFDSAAAGINQTLCEKLALAGIEPLVPIPNDPDALGAGRMGTLSSDTTLSEFVAVVKKQFGLRELQIVGDLAARVATVASACGSGGSFLKSAIDRGCDTLVTGETNFHTSLEAQANGINLVLLGHYASERFAVEMLAEKLDREFEETEVWASQQESDPLSWV
jgi:dinuclear metal center YbgI/SA1388 family protein